MTREAATEAQAREVLPAFGITPATVGPLGHGLINDTFAVSGPDGDYVLQRVHPVFAPEIHLNIAAVTQHLVRKSMVTPRLVYSLDGSPWVERGGKVWRLMTRMPGVSVDAADDPAQAHAAARLLGRFHSALDDLEHEFVGLRANVHDTPTHLQRLRDAVEQHPGHRLFAQVEPIAHQILRQAETLPPLAGARTRIVHGDPKLNNVLFESDTGPGRRQAQCWIDLDTVAPMSLAVELGDAWRSWCNRSGEDEAEARFDAEVFEASWRGYRAGCTLELDADEREGLLHGVEWITLELAARFTADALFENYFGWDSSRFASAGDHNLRRAQGQWSLHHAVMKARVERARILSADGA